MSARLGINLSAVVDYDSSLPFLDLSKSSRIPLWDTRITPFSTIGMANLDADGWINNHIAPARPIVYVVGDSNVGLPTGQYTVFYDGEGDIIYRFGATKDTRLSEHGKDVINYVSGQLFAYQVNRVNQSNYIRNIRIYRSDLHLANEAFNPSYVSVIQPFKVIRYMNWGRINGSPLLQWKDRPVKSNSTYATNKGVPIELMIAFSNQLKSAPWFCVPHMANDDYVRRFALLVRDNLDPSLRIYIEYSNEIWNGIFSQHQWINRRAQSERLSLFQWFGRRSAQVIAIFKEILGIDRVIGVLGAQAANIGATMQAYNYVSNIGLKSNINAIAIAPYFGGYLGMPEFASQVEKMSLNDIFDEIEKGGILKRANGSVVAVNGSIAQSAEWMKDYADFSVQNEDINVIAYEGGQHLAGVMGVENNKSITDLFVSANRDLRMGQAYDRYMAEWRRHFGGSLFCHYSCVRLPSKWGCFGAMENLTDINNPKYQSLLRNL